MNTVRDPDCRECLSGRPHCHGALLRHPSQHVQCTDPDCAQPEVLLHALIMDCDAVGCRCDEIAVRRVAI